MTLTNATTVIDVSVPARSATGFPLALPGRLSLPDPARGLVLFAHGSGSSRSSPRNRYVAAVLHEAWIGTLLFDLLTEQEAADRMNVFDIGLLADRLEAAVTLVQSLDTTAALPLGLFGASTGAAAALVAAARVPRVAAVVSRGGRPDMAGAALGRPLPDAAHRGRPRRGGARAQPARARRPRRRETARHRARGDASVRGTRHARGGRPPRGRVVRLPLSLRVTPRSRT